MDALRARWTFLQQTAGCQRFPTDLRSRLIRFTVPVDGDAATLSPHYFPKQPPGAERPPESLSSEQEEGKEDPEESPLEVCIGGGSHWVRRCRRGETGAEVMKCAVFADSVSALVRDGALRRSGACLGGHRRGGEARPRHTRLPVGDSFGAPVCCYRHALSLLLSKVLFSCWVDICLTARHTCHLRERTSLNLDPSLSPGIVLNDKCICWSKTSLQSVRLQCKARLVGRLSG